MKLRAVAQLVEQKVAETMTHYAYPGTHWRQLRMNNPLERDYSYMSPSVRSAGARGPPGPRSLMQR
jgi:transposase-like protein